MTSFDAAQARYDRLMPEDMPGYFEHLDDCGGEQGEESCDCEQRIEEMKEDAEIERGERQAEDRAFDAAHDRGWEP